MGSWQRDQLPPPNLSTQNTRLRVSGSPPWAALTLAEALLLNAIPRGKQVSPHAACPHGTPRIHHFPKEKLPPMHATHQAHFPSPVCAIDFSEPECKSLYLKLIGENLTIPNSFESETHSIVFHLSFTSMPSFSFLPAHQRDYDSMHCQTGGIPPKGAKNALVSLQIKHRHTYNM